MSAEIMPASIQIIINTKKWPTFIIHEVTLRLTRSLDINNMYKVQKGGVFGLGFFLATLLWWWRFSTF